MAAAKERSTDTTTNPYEEGGGYGKFRKRPFRRSSHTTPYDRPQIGIGNNRNSNGWLSKIVDPAHRLIASSAHKLFASVFRKRLPPPHPPQLNEEAANKRVEAVPPSTALPKDSLDARVAFASGGDTPSTSYAKDGLSDLELILKQKTFTRSEIDRLTAVLQSRTVDLDAGCEEKKSEAVPLKVLSSLDRKEPTNTPVKENGTKNQLISTPTVSSTVLDEDVASPAELAKAYMGSRPSKLSPPMLGSRSQVLRGDNASLVPFPSKSPMMSLVPKSSGHSTFPENGYVTPRSRGRSAIYSMARTPYSRVRTASNVQGHATRVDAFGGASSSQSALDLENRFSGSKQGALKRRSSVLDNDIGSAGPIRRIRQKSNLLPVSGSLAIRGNGMATSQNLSSAKKLALAGESSRENVENNRNGSDLTTVPSKSSEVASKILQQLDVLVSSREKSPTKLSPSMLRGPALRSLENVDSSKFLGIVQDNDKPDVKNDISMSNSPDSIFQKIDKEQDGPTKFISSDKSLAAAVSKNVLNSLSDATTALISSIQPSTQKHRAFQMSAPEDMLEVDDDDNIYAPKSTTLAERKGKLDVPSNKISATEVVTMEKTSVFPEISRAESFLVNQKTSGTSEAPLDTEKGGGSTFAKSPLFSITPQQQVIVNGPSAVKSDEAVGLKDSSSMPSVFTFGDQPVSAKQANGTLPTADFGLKAAKSPWASSSPIVSEPAVKFVSPNQKVESSSSFDFFSAGATESVVKESESDRAGEKKSLKDRVAFTPSESVSAAGSTSSTGLFSFGTPVNGSALNNGLLASTPVFSSALQGSDNVTSKVSAPGSSAGAFANISSSVTSSLSVDTTNPNSLSTSAITQPAVAPIFKFGSSVSSTSLTETSIVGVEKSESKTKEANNLGANTVPVGAPLPAANTGSLSSGASSAIAGPGSSLFGNSSSATMGSRSSIFSATSTAAPGTGSSIFSFNAGTTSSVSTSQSEGFNPFTAGSVQASAPGTVLSTSSPSTITQFGPSSSGSSFGLGGSTASSGSSMFSSSSKPFSAGATFGLTSSTSSSDTITVASSSNTGSTLFSSSWQAPNSSVFGQTVGSSSTSIATPLFSFAASLASTAATSGAPVVFGSSSNASGASSTSTAATGSPFVFGSSSGAFGVPSTSNDASSSPVVFSSSSNAFGSSAPASSGSIFPFSSSTATTPSQPVFGTSTPGFAFGAPPSPSGNNDQMSMEDSMAEDTVQATTPAVSAFNQQPASSPAFAFGTPPSSGVANPFGSTTQSGANPFQFGGQPNMGFSTPQNPSPFQASSSLGGSFSLGTGGADKSGRRMVKVKKSLRKK